MAHRMQFWRLEWMTRFFHLDNLQPDNSLPRRANEVDCHLYSTVNPVVGCRT